MRIIRIYNIAMQRNYPVSTRDESPSEVLPPPHGAWGGATLGSSRISSQALFSGATEIEIEHRGALYRLRQTSLGKLILTK